MYVRYVTQSGKICLAGAGDSGPPRILLHQHNIPHLSYLAWQAVPQFGLWRRERSPLLKA
jgi:hypothetical protein